MNAINKNSTILGLYLIMLKATALSHLILYALKIESGFGMC